MQKRKKSSPVVNILKTVGFFGTVIGLIVLAVYFWKGSSSNSEKAKPEGYKYIDISTLSDFDYYTPLPGEKPKEDLLAKNQIPENIKQLTGQRVTISGFMMPVSVDEQGLVEEFALNGNYDMCFYGAPSQINQWVHVTMQDGAKAVFTHNPTIVSGVLEVGEEIRDGQVISLYRLSGHKASTSSGRGF